MNENEEIKEEQDWLTTTSNFEPEETCEWCQ